MQLTAAGVEDLSESPSVEFGIRMVQSQTKPKHHPVSESSRGVGSQTSLTQRQQLASQEAKSAARISTLRRIQQNIEDLLALSNAEHCALASGTSDVPLKQQYKTEVSRLLNDLGKLIKPAGQTPSSKSAPALTKHRPGTSRVQLRLSEDLARILVEFAKAGRRPSVVVENTMWKDAQFRDAAEILGIEAPALPATPKKLRRIQPVRPL